MSYQLTMKGDDRFSRTLARQTLDMFLAKFPGIKPNGKGFAFDERPKRWMEIDVEVVNEQGDNIEEPGKTYDKFNCIRFNIPAAFVGDAVERDYFPTALGIAEMFGWLLYDDQTGQRVMSGERAKKPWWRFW